MTLRLSSLSKILLDTSPVVKNHADHVHWVNRNLLLSRKRKLAQLFEVTVHATVDTVKYDNPEYRNNERAFLDANDLER